MAITLDGSTANQFSQLSVAVAGTDGAVSLGEKINLLEDALSVDYSTYSLAMVLHHAGLNASIFSSTKSVLFDGVDEYVTMGNVLSFERTDSFSVSAWFKTTSTTGGEIVAKREAGIATVARGWSLNFKSTQIRVQLIYNSYGNKIDVRCNLTDGVYNDGNWHHIVMTYDGSSLAAGVKIHLDRSEQSPIVYTDALTSTITNNCPLLIGARGGTIPNNEIQGWWPGNLDEVALYAKSLSQSEVDVIYGAGTARDLSLLDTATDLVGWWRMGDGDIFPTLTDNSENNYDGTMTNMEIGDIVTDTPTFMNTKSVVFDGINEYVTMGNVLAYDRTDAFSVFAWIKTTGTADQYIIAKQRGDLGKNGYVLQILGQKITAILRNNYSYRHEKSTVALVTTDVWCHVGFTWDATGISGLKIYANGVEVATTTTWDTLGANSIVDDSSFMIGARSTPVYFFLGNIDEATVWDKSLSADEVAELYDSGEVNNCLEHSAAANLTGWWRMGDGDTYPTLTDSSSNSNYGIMTNMEESNIVIDTPM